jgi:feruloyl-CoA synthase
MARRTKLADGTLGEWRHITYAQAWQSARNIAQGLIDRGLNAERPVVILSENSLEHALLALGAMVAGVPFVPTSPPYSLVSVDYDKLKHVLKPSPRVWSSPRMHATPKPLPPRSMPAWKWCWSKARSKAAA